MAHFQQRKFVAEVRSRFPEFFERAKVLEVGSWTYNDTIRTLFHSCDYVGADVAGGPDVDLVVPGQDLGFPTGHFDVVISCECFEHNPFWLETFLNMARMLRPGGLFVLTCASTGRGEHGTSRTSPGASLTAVEQHPDYYQNLSKRDFERRITLENHFSHHLFMTNLYSKDLYFIGLKRGAAADPMLAGKLASLRRAAKEIKLVGRVTMMRAVAAYAEWLGKWALCRVLGERKYHGLRHFVRPRK